MSDDKQDAAEPEGIQSDTSEETVAQVQSNSDEKPPTRGEEFRMYQQMLSNTRTTKSFDPSNPPQKHRSTKSIPPPKKE